MDVNKNIKAIIFDLDGTLVDLPVDWVKVKKLVNKGPKQSLGKRVEELIKANDSKALEQIKKHEIAALKRTIVDPTVKGVLNTLKQDHSIAILTRNSRHAAEEFLQMHDIDPKQYFIIGREDTSRLKPHPEGMLLILNKFKVKPSETVLVGDTRHDIELAETAGLYTILIGDKAKINNKIRGYKVGSLSSVPDIINNIEREND